LNSPKGTFQKLQEGSVQAGSDFRYNVYGVSLRSEIALALPEYTHPGFSEIQIQIGSPDAFSALIDQVELKTRSEWFRYAHLSDGSTYVRWDDLGEFLVSSDGRRVVCVPASAASPESFQVYLLGQAISYALVKSGFEPLHATAVEVDGEAIAFLGLSGYGKSSLAACFLAAGHVLLTDDLLLLHTGPGGLEAYPGPPRIKLFPHMARRFFGKSSGIPMNLFTQKSVIPFEQSRARPVPLRAIYSIATPRENRRARKVEMEPLSARDAFLVVVKNTFNYVLVDADRLRRQVLQTTHLVSTIPVKKLSYPRRLDELPSVREAILSDVKEIRNQAALVKPS